MKIVFTLCLSVSVANSFLSSLKYPAGINPGFSKAERTAYRRDNDEKKSDLHPF
jgi:hypothetical protein